MKFDQWAVRYDIDPDHYKSRIEQLREDLLEQQFRLADSGRPVILVIAGVDGAGKGVLVHRLNEWMDPRRIETNTFWDPSDEEEERPYFWRYWRRLPARGHTGIFLGSWYRQPLQHRVDGTIDDDGLHHAARRIRSFEHQLTADGAILIKLWLHISESTQRRQLEEKAPKTQQNPRVTDNPYELRGLYQPTLEAAARLIQQTQSVECPWHVIDAEDRNSRELTAGEIILGALRARLDSKSASASLATLAAPVDYLAAVPLQKSLSASDYKTRLADNQERLQDLVWRAYRDKRSLVVAFEGWDAAGKGSAIRRVTAAIDPRLYTLVQIAAPSDEEIDYHYLWRFWRRLQRDGRATLFDRSWYGRVLVERVEGFASDAEWQRAYDEINDFERDLVEHGNIVAKFWLHISAEEQLERFQAREKEARKRYKITDEDWRNREKWPAYAAAVNQMVSMTDSKHARWHLIAGNCKRHARVRILETLCETLEKALE
ncbi:polyphosphate:AMP phosphotransferase [Haliea sp. E17]|uniref:polyphosphate:AMP phosphotransferase n=1 Tax=Haliea sp. E17 TaxID=3401576 RepID=UPI003AABFABF